MNSFIFLLAILAPKSPFYSYEVLRSCVEEDSCVPKSFYHTDMKGQPEVKSQDHMLVWRGTLILPSNKNERVETVIHD
jgi:hypothetical protein